RGGLADAEVMESAVGALGRAFAGEHADGVFAAAAVGVDAAGVGVAAGQVLLTQEGEQFAPGLVGGGGDLGDRLVAERLAVVLDADGLVADPVFGGFVGDGFQALRPVAQVAQVLGGEGLDGVVVALAEGEEGAVERLSPSPLGSGVGVRVRASGASMGGRTLSPGPSPGGGGEQVGAVVKVPGLRALRGIEVVAGLPAGQG